MKVIIKLLLDFIAAYLSIVIVVGLTLMGGWMIRMFFPDWAISAIVFISAVVSILSYLGGDLDD